MSSFAILMVFIFAISLASCTSGRKTKHVEPEMETIVTKAGFSGIPLKVEFIKGTAHNHPLMAIWLEDMDGDYMAPWIDTDQWMQDQGYIRYQGEWRIPQDVLLEKLVEKDVLSPLEAQIIKDETKQLVAEEIAEILDLTQDLNKKAAGLSADAKQKISLGRGLVRSDVAAVLFDEPLTVIDPHLKWQLRRKLKEIHEQLKLTLIYVTHDQVEALTFADQVILMYEGEIVQIGTPEDLFENPRHKFVGYFIGSPGMNFLPCTLEGQNALVDGITIPLAEETAALGAKAAGALELGIRPMHIEVHAADVDDGVPVTIEAVEDQGSFKILSMMFNGHALRARVPEGHPVPERQAWLRFPPLQTKLFADERLVI